MAIYFAGNEYDFAYHAGEDVSKALAAGQEYYSDVMEPPTPAHSFSIRAGGRGNTRGYNQPGNFGSIAAGSSASYDTPGGKSVTVIHARRLRGDELVFALSGAAQLAADFPSRIVATKTTGATATVTCVPHDPDQISAVSGGVRRDYDVESGSLTDVFASNQTVRIDLYY